MASTAAHHHLFVLPFPHATSTSTNTTIIIITIIIIIIIIIMIVSIVSTLVPQHRCLPLHGHQEEAPATRQTSNKVSKVLLGKTSTRTFGSWDLGM